MDDIPDEHIATMAKGWSLAMKSSAARLVCVHDLDSEGLEKEITDGKLLLETVCTLVHCCVRRGQYR